MLSQQLVAAGETVVDVPATLASRIRVLGTGRSDKNDPNDALVRGDRGVARCRRLRDVAVADHAEVLRLLAKRNIDLGKQRTRVVCRLHNLIMELSPGGIAKELNASDAIDAGSSRCSRRRRPRRHAETSRSKCSPMCSASTNNSRHHIAASAPQWSRSSTSLTDLFGVGPIIACYLIGFTGDVTRFASRDHYAAYNGTAPVERSSGGRVVHRVSQRGNRRLNARVAHRRDLPDPPTEQ